MMMMTIQSVVVVDDEVRRCVNCRKNGVGRRYRLTSGREKDVNKKERYK